jgi:phage I-like protein
VIVAMAMPTAHSEHHVEQPPAVGWVQVLVYAVERGQCEIRVRWPDDALEEDAAGAAKRQRFARFVVAELEADLAAI